MNGFGMQYLSNFKKKGVLTMKKTFLFTIAMVFVAGLGTVYAADYNGDSYYGDIFQIAPAALTHANSAFEGSAAGSARTKVNSNDFSIYNDLFEIAPAASNSRVVEGSAAGSLRQNMAGKESSVRNYDLFEISR